MFHVLNYVQTNSINSMWAPEKKDTFLSNFYFDPIDPLSLF